MMGRADWYSLGSFSLSSTHTSEMIFFSFFFLLRNALKTKPKTLLCSV